MEVIIFSGADQVAEYAADIVGQMLAHKPDCVLGLATGSTPVAMYRCLAQRYRDGALSFARATTFNLDEYLGLDSDNSHSYRSYMRRELFDHVDLESERTHLPECAPGEDPRAVGPAYESLINKCGGIDLQILGIGRNGHIGFNEPSSSLASRTRVKTLARRTVSDNHRLFDSPAEQPGMAITMGVATIMDAHRVLLLATGEHKAEAVRAAVEGSISAMHPASVLQAHRRVRVLVDEAAASRLTLVEYYRRVHTQAEWIAGEFSVSGVCDPWFQDGDG